MADNNPKLTLHLHNTREVLLAQREDIFRRFQALQTELVSNSTEIEALDTVMHMFNPEHVAVDVRSDANVAAMLVVSRRTVQLEAGVSEAALGDTTAPTDADTKAAPAIKVTSAKRKPMTKKLSVKEQIAAVDAALGAKAERSPVSQAISSYFQNTGRNDTILKILESKSEPVNAAMVTKDYKALYPFPDDSAEFRAMHAQRISAALHYLKARGQAERIATEKSEGKSGDNVSWELSKSYRNSLRKGRLTGRPKAADQTVSDAETIVEEPRLAVGAN